MGFQTESFIHRVSRRLADSNRWKRPERNVHVSAPQHPDLTRELAARGAAEPTPDNLAGSPVGSSLVEMSPAPTRLGAVKTPAPGFLNPHREVLSFAPVSSQPFLSWQSLHPLWVPR